MFKHCADVNIETQNLRNHCTRKSDNERKDKMARVGVILSIMLVVTLVSYADVEVQTEQLNPADSASKFTTIVGPSKSDIASDAQFKIVFDAIRELMRPPQPKRRRVGFKTKPD